MNYVRERLLSQSSTVAYLSMMKFSPHSFLMGADFVFGVVNEWNESTLLCENDLLCIVPLGWLSRLFIQKPLCWFRGRGNRQTTPRATKPKFQFLPRSSFFFFLVRVCVFPPLTVFYSTGTQRVPQQTGRWCVKSFCPVSLSALAAKQGFYYGTHDILYRFSGSINTETKLRKRLFLEA